MASSSSSTQTCRYRVFSSFHGQDVRKTFVSHLRKQFKYNGITMFDDQRIERSQTIAPSLTEAIWESKILIVVLSKNYASSSWCLDELVEILKCKEDIGQIVMTVFYGVDPSDVRNQTGDFGIAFNETCAYKTEEEKRKWSQALTNVGNIVGEHLLNWDNEAEMVKKIAKDVFDKLNATPSKDFDGLVGLEAHLREMESLLDLDDDGVKMVGISGPAGIGKTTIARALHSLLYNRFQLTTFVDNLRGSYHSGFDEYGLKLCLQEQFLSKVLNHNGIRICHLGAIKENLCDQKVLIILDDVNKLNQLEALANETTWFGPGSRIVVTTENRELLQQHGIDNTYHVGFPSREEALEILCRYAFRQISPHNGFKEFFGRTTELCGNLPLALRVVGSSLRGKKEDEWEDVTNRIETNLDRDIEEVLRVGYESLDENEQSLFLHIAVFFNYKDGDLVKAMFVDSPLDVKRGLNILDNRSLIEISTYGERMVMHRLLQQMARQAIHKQEPWKRQILMDAHEICDVLENETGTKNVVGISFDISGISEVFISEKAFKRMINLRFLSVYKSRDNGNERMYIPEEMEFPRRLRLLHWEAYTSKCLPRTFRPENLVELCMWDSQLEYLWQGTQPLKNLKKMDLRRSFHLKGLPDLSNATNLEILKLSDCTSLVEIPSSFSHLRKLKTLWLEGCINLQVITPHLNLSSLEFIDMKGCSKLKNIPDMSTNIKEVYVALRLSENVKGLTRLSTSLWWLDLSNSDIERIPNCIKALHHQLRNLNLSGCRKLTSIPELPSSLHILYADDCESLETVVLNSPNAELRFSNCFKLGQQTQRAIIQCSLSPAVLPGSQVPAEFDHVARGNLLTIRLNGGNNHPLSAASRLKLCVVVSPNRQIRVYKSYSQYLLCRCIGKGVVDEVCVGIVSKYRAEHLVIFHPRLPFIDQSFEVSREIEFEFSSSYHSFDIIECGAKIWTGEKSYPSELEKIFEDNETTEEKYPNEECDILSNGSYEFDPSGASEDNTEYGDSINGVNCDENLEGERYTDCWNWLFLCFDFSQFLRNIGRKTIKSRNNLVK